jgi:hypothetical protein
MAAEEEEEAIKLVEGTEGVDFGVLYYYTGIRFDILLSNICR